MTVVARLQGTVNTDGTVDDEGQRMFYVLRITGLPYDFCAVHNPYDSAEFGAGALTIGSGRTAIPGMAAPDGDLTQEIEDIIGGIATPERIKIRLIDFDAYDEDGEYQVLARLLSPGVATSTPGGYFELASDIPASFGAGDDVSLRSGTITPDDGFYTVGRETLRLEDFGAPVDGVSTGVIVGDRNRFPCSSVYPPIPYHRVVRTETDGAALGRNILVTPYDIAFTMDGRSAALYVGMLDEAGMPLPESDWQLRLVGKIKGTGDAAGKTFEIEIESLIGDLKGAAVAPGLGIARIKDDQILLPATTGTAGTNWNWLECTKFTGRSDGSLYNTRRVVVDASDVPDGNFTLELLLRKVNDAFIASVASGAYEHRMYASTITGDDGLLHVVIFTYGWPGEQWPRLALEGSRNCFLSALGFTSDEAGGIRVELNEELEVIGTSGFNKMRRAVAQRPAPNVFIPASQAVLSGPARYAVQGEDGSTSQFFFTDQGDGRAFAQFGDGSIVELQDADTTDGPLKLTTGPRWRWSIGRRELVDEESPEPFYYVGWGSKATVRQVVVAGDRDSPVDAGLFVGRLIASHDEASALDDLNYYPEGVGLGWNQILDGDSVRVITSYGESFPREYIVTSDTKLDDILGPILKAYGLAVIWDPEMSLVSFRPLRFPTAATAHTMPLSDSNKTRVDDETVGGTDPQNVRSSYTLKTAWDGGEGKFVGPDITLVDNIVQSTGVDFKPEKIEDKTLWFKADTDPFSYLAETTFMRRRLYQQPWKRLRRTFNRAGITMAPGSSHPIVESNLLNPFTGRRGITVDDQVFGLIVSITSNLAKPDQGMVTFLVDKYRKSSLFRSWSPVGLVDYDAAGHGYNTGTGVLTMARRYSSHPTNHDGWDFEVGDTVELIAWNSGESSLAYDQSTTVAAVAADGSTVTVDAGLPAIGTDIEVLLVLRHYTEATADREAEVAFQGSEAAMVIDAVAPAENHRWA